MLISYKWLQEFFDDDLPESADLVNSLTLKSFEIEGVEDVETDAGKDSVIDVDVLPNRAHDCLSHFGIAKEVAAITDLKLKNHEILEKEPDFETELKIENDNSGCRRYIGCEIKNINITESPIELRSKMQSLGQKSINNLVDITNIVMYELGQPMHAFDADKISGGKIIIRTAKAGESITTLDHKEVSLNEDILVIADAENPLAIAGIKGGKKAEVNLSTKNIILESANFNPTLVRKTARKINIATDSSKRFENEITPDLALNAMNRAIELIMQYASTEKTSVSNKIDSYPKKWRNYRTGVCLSEVNSVLGVNFSENEISNAFDKLNFKYEIVNPAEKIVEEALALLDRPYKYGASVFFDSPKSFDCSSLVSYVCSLAGYSIPRMVIDQFVFVEKISAKDLLPGDLVFSNTLVEKNKIDYESIEFLKGTKIEHGVDHVGIYIGENKVVHATEHDDLGVVEEDLKQSFGFKNIVGYGRLPKFNEKRFAVTVPMDRLDVKTSADLIEEVGRIIGYERVSDQEIKISNFKANPNLSYQLSIWLKNTLTDLGFSEIITYSFVSEGTLEPLKPIAEDKAYVRDTLLLGMKGAFEKNINNVDLLGLDHVKLFEIGKVFNKKAGDNSDTHQKMFPESKYQIEEKLMLSIGVRNKQGIKKPKPADLIREIVQKIENDLSIKVQAAINDQTDMLEICLDDLIENQNVISFLNQNFSGGNPKLSAIDSNVKFKSFSTYPFMLRDIAVWVPSITDKNEVINLIRQVAGDLLVKIKLFDVYEKENRTSYAYRLVFQSYEKTLNDEDANLIMKKITDLMVERGWEVR